MKIFMQTSHFDVSKIRRCLADGAIFSESFD